MKSTRINKQAFSMEDFEKGLMLAGLLSPSSISEFQERAMLEEHERELDKTKKSVYFKRVALAGEIVSQLYNENTFGRVKFQKLVYLCEYEAGMDMHERYSKFAAGPFDNKFMHSIDKELQKNNWFSSEKISSGNIVRHKYYPLENHHGYKKYYNSYFGSSNNKIQRIIDLFRTTSTEFTEIAATIHACFKELKQDEKEINIDELLRLFYNWAPEKKRFPKEKVVNAFEWMKHNELLTI